MPNPQGSGAAKRKLIQFLERRAWSPVLRAQAGDRGDTERKRLERVQRKTESQQERYRGYEDAGQLRQEFDDDLTSSAAKRTSADLEKLGLPTQRDVAEEFHALADRLGVTAQQKRRASTTKRRRVARARSTSGARSRSKSAGSKRKPGSSARSRSRSSR